MSHLYGNLGGQTAQVPTRKDMVVMDFSKAFDKVAHNKLISSQAIEKVQ